MLFSLRLICLSKQCSSNIIIIKKKQEIEFFIITAIIARRHNLEQLIMSVKLVLSSTTKK